MRTYTRAVDSMPVVDIPCLVIELEHDIGISIVELAVVVVWLSDRLKLLDSVDFEVFGSCLSEEGISFGSQLSHVLVALVSI